MDVKAPLVADSEASVASHPCEGPLDDPSMAAEFLAAINTASGNARCDASATASSVAAPMVIGFVGVQLVRSAPWAASLARNRRHRIEQLLERDAVVDVGAGQQERERDAAPVGDEVPLAARPAAVGRVRAGPRSPFFAAMDALSMQARLQSIRSASRNRRSNSRCRRSHTPAFCQSRSRRQQVTPEPQPISCGSISHGMPVRSTNRMPVSAARAATRGRPPFGLGGSAGSSGARIDQSSSDTRGEGIPPHESIPGTVQGF